VNIFEPAQYPETLFADILLPVPIPKFFTYRIPLHFNTLVKSGQRAIVQFGDRKILTGIIVNLHHEPPKDYEAKYILEILEDFPILRNVQLNFFQWIAEYYVCTMGEVLNAALPSGLKLSSESRVQLNPALNLEESEESFSERELQLLRALQHETLEYTQISKLLGIKTVYNILKSLVAKEAVILFEEVKEKYKPKTEKKIRLASNYVEPQALEELFAKLSSKPKQEEVLLKYLQQVPVLNDSKSNETGIAKNILLKHDEISESSLNTLIKKNVLEEFDFIVSRFGDADEQTAQVEVSLSSEQQKAMDEILKAFEQQQTALLFGITGSGKTEIYINLIKKALESGTQVLYLLPEIALTTQIVHRLKKVFGKNIGVFHSKFSDNERVEVWNGILTGRFKFVVGVRSAVFLPFDNLGLIIVDEEHESSYKQQDPAPRYHARDVSIMLGKMHYAKVLLGSATPSVESYANAIRGRYGFVSLSKRYGEAKLPTIKIADMGRERKQKTIKGEFSGSLLREIAETLGKKEQVIIFQNRRGYSPVLTCEDCGWVPKCVNCAVSLTYHQFRNSLVCHYCGYRESLPHECASCTSTRLKTVGYGTEKLEEELKIHFPEALVQRMDLDTTRSKTGYETIIEQFEKGETNILVGTQMVTKGLDFDHVSLVGIFNADRMIHFPDFRSYERAFQLITQVSGRAGRREKPGTVIIQTSSPDHPLLRTILQNNVEEFYASQIRDRELHFYPPFSRLIQITIKHIDKKIANACATAYFNLLKQNVSGLRLLGPAEPMVGKIRNQFLMTILLKIPKGKADLVQIKKTILELSNQLLKEKEYRNTRFNIDVDPL
jgi:primosomal protein N' (replication factor Y) (superfamily II helicase)